MKYLSMVLAIFIGVTLTSMASVLASVAPGESVAPKAGVEAVKPVAAGRATRGRVRNGVPRSPPGLAVCKQAMSWSEDLFLPVGETLRYLVNVDGLSVGTVDFKVASRGIYAGVFADEYRSLFKLDSFVSTLMPLHGQAASVVSAMDKTPIRSMNRYKVDEHEFDESISYSKAGRALTSTRARDGVKRTQKRLFDYAILDLVGAFYQVRRFPREMNGCVVIYGNQRAYTVWLKNEGEERIQTPVGYRLTDRYSLRYGSEYLKRPREGTLWISSDHKRIPYLVEVRGRHHLEAKIHFYEPGEEK